MLCVWGFIYSSTQFCIIVLFLNFLSIKSCTVVYGRCTVCLAEYHGEDILRILPYCGHSFHVNCIDIWLQQHSTCPVCRISLREFPERKRMMQPLFSSAIRTQYGTESFHARSYNCLLTRHAVSSRTDNSHGMDPIQENHCASEGHGAEVGENLTPLTDSNQSVKDSGNKHIESPSNPWIFKRWNRSCIRQDFQFQRVQIWCIKWKKVGIHIPLEYSKQAYCFTCGLL